ncbi:MAG TPA: contact-dependent growth inhibition system immunity protein [Candidatus Sulfotelmatobacter sp.]|nr:contact-dependent growth inhibition system immunity protein [Candidatus Sulfotelmatobacter sp.]
MKDQRLRLTFALLDRERGVALPPKLVEEFPLPAWYRAVSDIPLEELAVEDICKACRQQIHVAHIVPIALRLLKAAPLTGEMYDGELFVSLNSVGRNYWQDHKDEAMNLQLVAKKAREDEQLPG